MPRIKLADVARAAGVGTATASRALSAREHPDVSAETRRHVRSVADELGYRPSGAARAFRQRDFHAVSFVMPDQLWSWWEPALQAAFGAARSQGYNVLVQPTTAFGGHSGDVADVISALADVPTEGVLLFGFAADTRMLRSAEALRLPVVAIDNTAEDALVPTLSVDNGCGVELAMRHLVQAGRRHIAYVGPEGELFYQRERLDSYRAALEAAGLTVDPDLIVKSGGALDVLGEDNARPLEALLASGMPLDAVLCETDENAAIVLRSLRRRGLRVPDDVAVVGFDDSRLAAALDPPLTTVHQPYEHLGQRAVELLLEQITGTPTPAGRTVLPPTLTVRESSR